MIKFQNVCKIYETNNEKIEALKDINLTVEKGDIFGVIGFSGAGKSTLIRTVNLLEKPTTGKVLVEGKDLTTLTNSKLRKEQKKIGMIFQHFNLLHSKTVYQNVALPLVLSKVRKNEIEQRVKDTLSFVGLSDKADRYPDELSGGQKQRVGIARALVTNPSILLCDEATSALDPETTTSILKLLKKINNEYNITILIITHEMEVIKEICNQVAVMEDGRVIERANIFDIVTRPKTETTKKFVQSIINDDIPLSIKNQMKKNNGRSRTFRLKYIGTSSNQPIVSQIAKNFNVEVNILHGNIIDIQGKPFGNLLLELIGNEIERAIQFAKNMNVHIEEVKLNGNRD